MASAPGGSTAPDATNSAFKFEVDPTLIHLPDSDDENDGWYGDEQQREESPTVAGSVGSVESKTGPVAHGYLSVDDVSSEGGRSDSSPTDTSGTSIFDHVRENGHTYHRNVEYLMPNDETERERLDMQHHLWMLTLDDQLYLAPLGADVQDVLDIGTGTGIWAIEFADRYPESRVTGLDLSPIQPEFTPPNCWFEILDIEDEWGFRNSIDYIHGRSLASSLHAPARVVGHAFDSLRPGGWLELQDVIMMWDSVDGTFEGTATSRLFKICMDAAERGGQPWNYTSNYRRYMEEAGFVDIREKHYSWPVGPWPKGKYYKTLGLWYQQMLLAGIRGLVMGVLSRNEGWSVEQIEVMLVDIRRELKDMRIHAYQPVIVITGRKPVD